MDCNESQEHMSAYLDDELAPAAAANISAHIASCAACRQQHENLMQLRAMVRANATSFVAPSSLRANILGDSRRRPRGTSGTSGRRTIATWLPVFGTPQWARINLGIASICALAFVAMLSLYLQTPSRTDLLQQEIIAAHYRSLQVDHLADVASSDQHTVKPWFSGKLDYSPPVTDFAAQGFALIGGRLDYLNRRPVAGLAYRHGKHLLNLFVWPDEPGAHVRQELSSVHGFQLLSWTQAGMAYTAISDMNAHDLLEFKNLLLAQTDKEQKEPASASK